VAARLRRELEAEVEMVRGRYGEFKVRCPSRSRYGTGELSDARAGATLQVKGVPFDFPDDVLLHNLSLESAVLRRHAALRYRARLWASDLMRNRSPFLKTESLSLWRLGKAHPWRSCMRTHSFPFQAHRSIRARLQGSVAVSPNIARFFLACSNVSVGWFEAYSLVYSPAK
jgi:hypothetical protein